MDKDVKDMLVYFAEEDLPIWDLLASFDDEDNVKTLKKMLPEPFFTIIKSIAQKTLKALDWHEEFEEAHMDIRKEIQKVDAKLRNHRHQMDKNYSAKAEF